MVSWRSGFMELDRVCLKNDTPAGKILEKFLIYPKSPLFARLPISRLPVRIARRKRKFDEPARRHQGWLTISPPQANLRLRIAGRSVLQAGRVEIMRPLRGYPGGSTNQGIT